MEFASGLYDGELKGFVRQLTRLQDALGSMQDAEVASSRLQAIALTEEGASLSRAAIFAMGGVAGQYRSEAEHLLSGMPKLLRLLEGKEWKRARSLLELRQKAAAASVLPPTAGTTAARPIGVTGRARPALRRPTDSPVTARPTVSPQPETAGGPGVSPGGGEGAEMTDESAIDGDRTADEEVAAGTEALVENGSIPRPPTGCSRLRS